MSTYTLHDVVLPDSLDDDTAAAHEFEAVYALLERASQHRNQLFEQLHSPEEKLGSLRGTSSEALEVVALRDGDALRGLLTIYLSMDESTEVVDFGIDIDPMLDDAEQRAMHEALVARVHQRGAELGRTTFMGGSIGAAHGAYTAATGHGASDGTDPEAAPLVARGYSLEQVYRCSEAHLDRIPDLDERYEAALAAAAGYTLATWENETPLEHVSGMIRLHEAMSTDAPVGALALEPEIWTPDRLREFERSKMVGGRTLRTVVAVHASSGELAGFTTYFIGSSSVARQHDTLVTQAHRGHGLGLLLKLAGLRILRDQYPEHRRVRTMNAEENRHMLRINEAVGFEPVMYECVWQLQTKANDG